MRTTVLGRTGVELSRVGFGAWALGGGGWEWGWGAQSDEESVAAIHRALELGINWIDTAAQYGFGHSEQVVGRALAGLEPRPYVFTKCSQLEGPDGTTVHSLKRDSIRRECEGALERLGVDAIDLYQIHFPIPDEELEEGWTTLAELRGEGLVRHIGVSNFSVEQLERAEAIAPVETLQPPYSLLDRGIEDGVLPWCEERDVGVLVYSPMASGLLTGRMTRERVESLPADDWRRRDGRFQGEQPRPRCAAGGAAARDRGRARRDARARSRWRGRSRNRAWTRRSSASAAPTRSRTCSRSRPSSSSRPGSSTR